MPCVGPYKYDSFLEKQHHSSLNYSVIYRKRNINKMKFVFIAIALIGAVAADVSHLSGSRRAALDSATQGPNPQDIATPEPEYIDIDLPEPPRPAPVARAQFHGLNSLPSAESTPAHVFSSSGYKYKRPVNYRRTHRLRY